MCRFSISKDILRLVGIVVLSCQVGWAAEERTSDFQYEEDLVHIKRVVASLGAELNKAIYPYELSCVLVRHSDNGADIAMILVVPLPRLGVAIIKQSDKTKTIVDETSFEGFLESQSKTTRTDIRREMETIRLRLSRGGYILGKTDNWFSIVVWLRHDGAGRNQESE